MIDATQLSAPISAFRVETVKESILLETVGKLLQDILDLLANASTDASDNSSHLGRTQNRKRRKWFSRKYYASMMNLKEFYKGSIGKTFTGILSNALNKNFGRNH